MKRVCLQAGHQNIKNNCNPALRRSTGAGGEVEINIAVADKTAELLKKAGVEVKRVDANYNCDPEAPKTDWDLFLAIHCDMDYPNDGGSGFCDFPDPSIDYATKESQRIASYIERYFFPKLGINVKSRSNPNTRYYYMWRHLSKKTPCVLIEMGQVKDPHDYPILKDTNSVAKVLAESILGALGIEQKTKQEKEIEKLNANLDELRRERDTLRRKLKELEERTSKEINSKTKHIGELQKTTAELNSMLATNASVIKSYEAEVEVLRNQKSLLASQIDALQSKLEETNQSVILLTEENEKLKEELKKKEVSVMVKDYPQWKIIAWRYLRVFLASFLVTFTAGFTGVADITALKALVMSAITGGITALAKYLRDELGASKLPL